MKNKTIITAVLTFGIISFERSFRTETNDNKGVTIGGIIPLKNALFSCDDIIFELCK